MSHYPGHLREAFCAWLEQGCPDHAEVEVDYEPVLWPARKLLGRTAHCTDILPSTFCDDAEVPLGSTYAAAAQRQLAQGKLPLQLGPPPMRTRIGDIR